MNRTLIKNGRLVDPANRLDEAGDVLIEDGRIAAVGLGLAAGDAEIYDASGLVVGPGFIDLRAQLREPGLEHAEDIESGSRAAAAGGFTAVCCLPETSPVNDSATVTSFLVERASNRAVVKVWPIGALTKDGAGEQLAEIGSMHEAGAAAVGDGEHTVIDSGVMRRALRYADSFGLTVMAHCEDPSLSGDDGIHEGVLSSRLGLSGVPVAAESAVVARDLILCRSTGARLHVAHLSAAESIRAIASAKAENVPVTAEVAAHHLVLSVADMPDYDSNYKIRPPLRDVSDREALLEAAASGAIDAVVSDHSPHTGNVKMQEFERCPFGVAGLETAVALALEALVHSGRASLARLIELFTSGPAGVLGVERGGITAGAEADLTLLNLESEWTFDLNRSYSKSRNSPFGGRVFRGGPAATFFAGRLVWDRQEGLRN